MKSNKFKLRSLIILFVLASAIVVGYFSKKEKSTIRVSGLRNDSVNLKSIDKISIHSYKNDSVLVVNQGKENFVLFLTNSQEMGGEQFKINKDTICKLNSLAYEKENDSIIAIYYSENDTEQISIRK
jgi:hypothetical protein